MSLEQVVLRIPTAVLLLKADPGSGPALDELDAGLDDIGASVLSSTVRLSVAAPPTQPSKPVDELHTTIAHLRAAAAALDELAGGPAERVGTAETPTDGDDSILRALLVLHGIARQLA